MANFNVQILTLPGLPTAWHQTSVNRRCHGDGLMGNVPFCIEKKKNIYSPYKEDYLRKQLNALCPWSMTPFSLNSCKCVHKRSLVSDPAYGPMATQSCLSNLGNLRLHLWGFCYSQKISGVCSISYHRLDNSHVSKLKAISITLSGCHIRSSKCYIYFYIWNGTFPIKPSPWHCLSTNVWRQAWALRESKKT